MAAALPETPSSNVKALPYHVRALDAAEAAQRTLDALDAAANPPIVHPDRQEIDREYAEIPPAPEPYDEMAAAEAAVRRYIEITSRARATWTSADREFVELAATLPEIRALTTRRVA